MVVCAVCVSFGAQAQGTSPPPDAGTILREQEQKPLEVPTRPAPGIKLDEPARPALKPADTPRILLKGFRVTGNTAFAESELLGLVGEYVGKEAGFAEFDQAAARISRYYREHGYMVARRPTPTPKAGEWAKGTRDLVEALPGLAGLATYAVLAIAGAQAIDF